MEALWGGSEKNIKACWASNASETKQSAQTGSGRFISCTSVLEGGIQLYILGDTHSLVLLCTKQNIRVSPRREVGHSFRHVTFNPIELRHRSPPPASESFRYLDRPVPRRRLQTGRQAQLEPAEEKGGVGGVSHGVWPIFNYDRTVSGAASQLLCPSSGSEF